MSAPITASSSARRGGVPPQILQQQQLLSSEATAKFELGLTLVINAWQALALAVQNQWGGPDSADKRDWMCGAVAELYTDTPETDAEDLEAFLLQIMLDEFDLAVEDDSAFQVATAISKLRNECAEGNFKSVEEMNSLYQEKQRLRGGRPEAINVAKGGENEDDESSEDDDGEDDDGEGMDVDGVEGEEAPALVRTRPEKVVDDDGFELVQSRKKR